MAHEKFTTQNYALRAFDDMPNPVTATSPSGEALIHKWEGLYLKAYYDPVHVLTIGYGTISNADLGIRVRPGMVITEAQANAWMRLELRAMERFVLKKIKVPIKQNQFDALMSFTYNVGVGNFAKSTLLRELNKGRYDAAGQQLLRWSMARDRRTSQWVTLRGLLNRRQDELRMWRGQTVSGLKPEKIIPVSRSDISAIPHPSPMSEALTKSPVAQVSAGGLVATVTASVAKAGVLLANPFIAFGAGVLVASLAFGLYYAWSKQREYSS
jgi:lysozyme